MDLGDSARTACGHDGLGRVHGEARDLVFVPDVESLAVLRRVIDDPHLPHGGAAVITTDKRGIIIKIMEY